MTTRAEAPMPTTTPTFSMRAAEAHVLAHGDARQRAFWKAAFGCGPVEVLVFELEPHQAEDGGWHGLVAGEPADGLASTVAALRTIAAVNLGEDIFEVGARTYARLLARRAPDGSFDAPGPWPGTGGDEVRRAWYTAAIGMLAPRLTGSTEPADARAIGDAAAAWLAGAWPRVAEAGPALWWAALGCCGPVATPAAQQVADDAAARLVAWLATPRPAADLAWIHEAARYAGRASDDAVRQAAWAALAAGQAPDGRWPGGSAAGWATDDVEATIHATRAIVQP